MIAIYKQDILSYMDPGMLNVFENLIICENSFPLVSTRQFDICSLCLNGPKFDGVLEPPCSLEYIRDPVDLQWTYKVCNFYPQSQPAKLGPSCKFVLPV